MRGNGLSPDWVDHYIVASTIPPSEEGFPTLLGPIVGTLGSAPRYFIPGPGTDESLGEVDAEWVEDQLSSGASWRLPAPVPYQKGQRVLAWGMAGPVEVLSLEELRSRLARAYKEALTMASAEVARRDDRKALLHARQAAACRGGDPLALRAVATLGAEHLPAPAREHLSNRLARIKEAEMGRALDEARRDPALSALLARIEPPVGAISALGHPPAFLRHVLKDGHARVTMSDLRERWQPGHCAA